MAFIWKYGSEEYFSAFFEMNKFNAGIKSINYVCDAKQKVELWHVNFGWFHDMISHNPMPLLAVLASRLAEIGVRTTFMIMTSTATLLFEELGQRIDDLAEKLAQPSSNVHKMSKYLDEWKSHYNLVCEVTEHINRSFGVALILVCLIDFAVPIIQFANVLHFQGTNIQYNLQFIHIILRFLFILIASHRLESNVLFCSILVLFISIFINLIRYTGERIKRNVHKLQCGGPRF